MCPNRDLNTTAIGIATDYPDYSPLTVSSELYRFYGRPMDRAGHYFIHLLKCIRADWPLTMQVEQIKSTLCST